MNATRFPAVLLISLCLGTMVLCANASETVDNDPMKVRGSPGFPIKNPIDSYILAKLNEARISPSRRCSDEEFIRRASLDVIGVIPTIDAIQYFLADPRSDKRERLIDSLLANERYGAHWAIMWGDLLREHSQTRQEEGSYPGTYRNWLRDALNNNMSYDRFMSELVRSSGRADQGGAVNFYLRDGTNRVETANTISSAFMGTRMACAQCHDHPFDKWEQKDFHRLMAFISPRVSVRTDDLATLARLSKVPNLDPDVAGKVKPFADQAASLLSERDAWEAKQIKEGKKVEPSANGNQGEGGRRRRGNPNDLSNKPAASPDDPNAKAQDLIKKMRAAVATLGQDKSDRFNQLFGNIRVNVVRENTSGDYRMPNDGDGAVNGHGNEVVPPIFPWNDTMTAGSDRRTDLAKFIAASPLFAQVHVNRLWAALMGKGLVDPPDDFRPKNAPSHPELLTYLADELVRSKFDTKHVLRLILTSSAYERSSVPESANRSDTTLFSHRQLRRMTAEQLFDSILVATGQADPKVNLAMASSAPGLAAPDATKGSKQPAGTSDGGMMGGMMGMMNASDNGSGVWAFDQPTPSNLGSFMNTFNQPSREQFTFQRDTAATITQALELFNGRPINDAVKKDKNSLVQVLIDKKLNVGQIVQDLYMATLARLPNGQEAQVAIGYVGSNARNKLEDLHWALMNTREFMFIK